jgi:LysM repeat protein
VAEKAGKAAPAMAIAGVLVAVPQAHAAAKAPVKTTTVTERVHTDGLIKSNRVHTDALIKSNGEKAASRTYTVLPGDTLSAIAQRFYGNPADWPWLYHVNDSIVQDPNLIYVGQNLNVPSDPPANAASYTPKHSSSAVLTSPSNASASSPSSTSPSSASSTTASSAPNTSAGLSGTLGCSGLEALWEDAGGSPAEAYMAAEIAMAESGGDQYALSPSDDYGYWQINASHGSLATFDAYGNAQAAVSISADGTDWYPWTTYVSGAYEGRC